MLDTDGLINLGHHICDLLNEASALGIDVDEEMKPVAAKLLAVSDALHADDIRQIRASWHRLTELVQ